VSTVHDLVRCTPSSDDQSSKSHDGNFPWVCYHVLKYWYWYIEIPCHRIAVQCQWCSMPNVADAATLLRQAAITLPRLDGCCCFSAQSLVVSDGMDRCVGMVSLIPLAECGIQFRAPYSCCCFCCCYCFTCALVYNRFFRMRKSRAWFNRLSSPLRIRRRQKPHHWATLVSRSHVDTVHSLRLYPITDNRAEQHVRWLIFHCAYQRMGLSKWTAHSRRSAGGVLVFEIGSSRHRSDD